MEWFHSQFCRSECQNENGDILVMFWGIPKFYMKQKRCKCINSLFGKLIRKLIQLLNWQENGTKAFFIWLHYISEWWRFKLGWIVSLIWFSVRSTGKVEMLLIFLLFIGILEEKWRLGVYIGFRKVQMGLHGGDHIMEPQ